MLSRRAFLAAGLLMAGELRAGDDALLTQLRQIEQSVNGRLGVAIEDSHSGRRWQYRGDERFPMCSTFKLLACAALLARVDAGLAQLQQLQAYGEDELVRYSPVTQDYAGKGLSWAQLCEAALTRSDNTAGNLILRAIGGPAGLTAFARSLGDALTRLDRWETELNEARPGDPRDSTTPLAMNANLRTLLLGERLKPASREQLIAWLLANQTGDARLRAGLPRDWRVGDKTGAGEQGTNNDIAIAWPPQRAPLLISVYLTQSPASFEARNQALAAVAQALVRHL